ncbi:MAG: glycosyltransferase family A protein [Hyphomicrobiaceae bacterium]
MRLVVVIASFGRPDILAEMLRNLERQTRKPDLVILSLTQESDGPQEMTFSFDHQTIIGPRGLPAQRNSGLREALHVADSITFFDDDFVPADNYLARIEATFTANPDYAVIHGNVVADGITSKGLTFVEARAALAAAKAICEDDNPRIRNDASAYGCNMSFRARNLTPDTAFDERLGLYGWQEDRDFSCRVGRTGRVVCISNIVGVHLGVKGGRVNGVRMGYSQVVNPIYLIRKGTMPIADAARLMSRNLLANAVKSLRPEPWVDRRGRLRGNLIGLAHVMSGRIEPEHVHKL